MNKETKRLNRQAGRFNLIECIEHWKNHNCKRYYIGNHYGIMANVYDYLHFTLKPVEDWRKRVGEFDYFKVEKFTDEDIKEVAKSYIAEEYIKKLADERVCIDDL